MDGGGAVDAVRIDGEVGAGLTGCDAVVIGVPNQVPHLRCLLKVSS